MSGPLDPSQLDQRDRERRAKEAAEEAAMREREAVEAQATTTYHAMIEHLKQSGAERTPDELATELGADLDAVRRALEQAVKAGTVTESHGRYRAAQR